MPAWRTLPTLQRLPGVGAAAVARAGYNGAMRGKRVVVPGLGNRILGLAALLDPADSRPHCPKAAGEEEPGNEAREPER